MPLLRAECPRHARRLNPSFFHDRSQVLYLPFDKDDGDHARDRSGHSNHGTIYGATPTPGKVAGALSFDGVDDYVEMPDSPSLDLSVAVSIALWLKPSDLTGVRVIMDKGPAAAGDQDGQYQMLLLNGFGGGVCTDGGMQRVLDGEMPSVDQWSHLAMVFDGSVVKVYKNAVQTGSTLPVSGTWHPNDRPVTVGGRTEAYFVIGAIDEVRVFNRALSAAEIARLMRMRGI